MCATQARAMRPQPTPFGRPASDGARWWDFLILPKDLSRHILQRDLRMKHGLSPSLPRWQLRVIAGRSSRNFAAEWGWQLLVAHFLPSIGFHLLVVQAYC